MKKDPELPDTFPATTREQWKEQVLRDLDGADFDRKLVWRTYDGIAVQPFYTREDINPELQTQHELLKNREQNWVNYTEIRVENEQQANLEAKKMLTFDARGLLFHLTNTKEVDFGSLLKGLDPASLHISFKSDQPSPDVVRDYFRYCEKRGISLQAIQGFYEADILETQLTKGISPNFRRTKDLLRETRKAPGFHGLSIRSHTFVDSGANTTQEIAFLLNKVVEYTTLLADELPPQDIFNEIQLHAAIGGDYFLEIAKLRALRLLYPQVAGCFGAEKPSVQVLSSSCLWSKSLFDPNVNMLRNTTEAMSAVLGGCDALLIQPHNSSYEQSTDFSRRIALNISNILREEAYFHKVADPAGGSYYIENLTADLMRKSLELFRSMEAKGGFIEAFESGEISKNIRRVREQKEKDIASRKQVMVGTNKYPNLSEKIAADELPEYTYDPQLLLQPQRATRAFDLLRLKTQMHFREAGTIPKVYLACFGNLAMRKARATFSTEFFGTASFEILGEFTFTNTSQAALQAAKSNADIIVMCASDQDYESSAENFALTFKTNAPGKQLVLAGYPANLVEKLKVAGVDTFIHVKTNAIEVLSEFQEKLFELDKIA